MPDVLIQAPDIRCRSSGRRPRAFDTDFGCERTGTRRSRPKTGERYAGTAFNRELLADAGGDETVGSTPGNRRTSFRMRSASSSAIRSRMSRASSTIRKRAARRSAPGRCTAMSSRRRRPSADSGAAPRSTSVHGRRDGPSRSSPSRVDAL